MLLHEKMHFHSLFCLAEASRLGHAIKKGTLRSDRSRRKGERRSSWEETVSWTREAVLERESAPERVCKVLESERASEQGGSEGFESSVTNFIPLPTPHFSPLSEASTRPLRACSPARG